MSSLARRKFGKAGTAGFAVPPAAADLGAANGLYGGGGGGIPVNFGESRTATGLPRPVVVGGLEDEEFPREFETLVGMPLKKLGLGGCVGMVSKSSMGNAQNKNKQWTMLYNGLKNI